MWRLCPFVIVDVATREQLLATRHANTPSSGLTVWVA